MAIPTTRRIGQGDDDDDNDASLGRYRCCCRRRCFFLLGMRLRRRGSRASRQHNDAIHTIVGRFTTVYVEKALLSFSQLFGRARVCVSYLQ